MLVVWVWSCRRIGGDLLTMIDRRCRHPLQMLVISDSLSRGGLTEETEPASSAAGTVKLLKAVEAANGSMNRSLVSVLARLSGNWKGAGSMSAGVSENKSTVLSHDQWPARELSSVSLLTGKRSI